jgi:4-diphosphocytidyl-2-C-methyl-D-erythritol kinase
VTNSRPPRNVPSAVTVLAPAKINLILRILDRRTDGFHNLWSWMQTVGLYDDVSIRLNQGHGEIRLQCDDQSLRADHTNLVYRAAAAVLRQSERTAGLDIALTKRIPMGAGLGGGSSDAAATILGLNQLLELGWSQETMSTVGEALGSDVPFFFFSPSAVVSGRGEQVTPVHMTGTRWIVLVNPGFPVETKWAYQRLAMTRSHSGSIPADLVAAIKSEGSLAWEQVLREAQNDFEFAVFSAHPVLQAIKARLLSEGAETALLSGSGATVFGVFEDEQGASRAAMSFQTEPQLKVFAVPAESRPLTSASDIR